MVTKWQKKLKSDPISWLLSSNPWTRYATMVNLLGISPDSDEARMAKAEMVTHPLVKEKISETQQWLVKAAGRNSDPTISYFKLRMLTDFGLNKDDTGIESIIKSALSHNLEGMFAVRGEMPEVRRKKEEQDPFDPYAENWHISPCNSPIITYSIIKSNYWNDEVDMAVKTLRDKWLTPQGWFCHFFFVESQFKKLQAGCPMAGIMALDVFSLVPELKESIYAQNAFEPIQFHYEYGKTLYYFGRSKKFWTMKYPFVWYNALYLADVLTRFDFLKGNKMTEELVNWIESSQDENGRFKPTSIYMAYKGWDFANKKEASPWMTYLCCKILKQWYGE